MTLANPTHPVQYSNESLTIGTSPGAIVVTTAKFASGSVKKAAVANSRGAATVVYAVNGAPVGRVVSVSTTVTKGSARGACTSSFIPKVRPAQPAPPKPQLPPPPAPTSPLPGAPVVTRTSEAGGLIGLAWSEADGNGLPITGWKVSRDGVDTLGTGAWSTILPPSASQFTFRSLVLSRTYRVAVAAVTDAGVGPATVRSITDNNASSLTGAPCEDAGDVVNKYGGYGVCDGFTYVPYGHIAIYDVSATRVTDGIAIRYTANSAPGYAYYPYYPYYGSVLSNAYIDINGSLSQLGAVTKTFDVPAYQSVYGATTRYQFVSGSFDSGRATLTVNGLSYDSSSGSPVTSTEVIGVDIQ